jgi:hypothetical protein
MNPQTRNNPKEGLPLMLDLLPRTAAAIVTRAPMANGFPDPGQGVAPPGADKILELLRWGLWLATGGCILAAAMVGVQIALSAVRGDHHRHGASLGWVLMGAILVGSSTGIVSALM